MITLAAIPSDIHIERNLRSPDCAAFREKACFGRSQASIDCALGFDLGVTPELLYTLMANSGNNQISDLLFMYQMYIGLNFGFGSSPEYLACMFSCIYNGDDGAQACKPYIGNSNCSEGNLLPNHQARCVLTAKMMGEYCFHETPPPNSVWDPSLPSYTLQTVQIPPGLKVRFNHQCSNRLPVLPPSVSPTHPPLQPSASPSSPPPLVPSLSPLQPSADLSFNLTDLLESKPINYTKPNENTLEKGLLVSGSILALAIIALIFRYVTKHIARTSIARPVMVELNPM